MKHKDILYILISSLVLVIAWIGFNIYHIAKTTSINEDLQLQIIPINPQFDTATIQKLKTRIQVTPINTLEIVSPTPQAPTPAPIKPIPAITQATQFDIPVTRIGQ
jgi:hypothetical protein